MSSALDPLLDGRTPKQVAALKLVDPACGSGTFLLGLFDRLIHWHEEHYTANPGKDPERHYADTTGRRRLTSDFKGQIVVNNVHGTDIGPQAVEVAQMSLYLRILEEETAASLTSQPRLFEGARLPSLSRNVRAGNSLIETVNVPASLYGDFETRRSINPFDWGKTDTGFGAIFKDGGGFDLVIGNPPYTRVQALRQFHPAETKIIEKKYDSAVAGFDLASVFTERGLQLLRPKGKHRNSRTGGILTFITSRGFAETDAAEPLRGLLSKDKRMRSIVDFGAGRVFPEAGAYTVILTATAAPNDEWTLTRVPDPPNGEHVAQALRSPLLTARVPAAALTADAWTLSLPAENALIRRLTGTFRSLGAVSGDSIFQGIITGADGIFRAADIGPDPTDPARRLIRPFTANPGSAPIAAETWLLRPVYAGKSDFQPFRVAPSTEWVIFPYAEPTGGGSMTLLPFAKIAADAPNIAQWLNANRDKLTARQGTWTDTTWFQYSRRQNLEKFAAEKVLIPSMLDRLCATRDTDSHYFVNVSTGGYGIGTDPQFGATPEYIAALLNSTLLTWVLRRMSRAWRGGWFEARKGNLERLPIALPGQLEQNTLTVLYRQVQSAAEDRDRNPDDPTAARVANVAAQSFDHAVNALYGLTFAEIDTLKASGS